jgi:hypothetical protein
MIGRIACICKRGYLVFYNTYRFQESTNANSRSTFPQLAAI